MVEYPTDMSPPSGGQNASRKDGVYRRPVADGGSLGVS